MSWGFQKYPYTVSRSAVYSSRCHISATKFSAVKRWNDFCQVVEEIPDLQVNFAAAGDAVAVDAPMTLDRR